MNSISRTARKVSTRLATREGKDSYRDYIKDCWTSPLTFFRQLILRDTPCPTFRERHAAKPRRQCSFEAMPVTPVQFRSYVQIMRSLLRVSRPPPYYCIMFFRFCQELFSKNNPALAGF